MMKKVIVLLTALAVTAGFAGCQRESRPDQNGTSGLSSGKGVNTQLVLSVANSTAQTKQTADAVQMTGGFQGLKDAYLLTYTQAADGKILAAPATSPNEPIELNYLFSGEATRRVVNVKLAENTNTLVFYGKGVKTAQPDKYGKLGAYSVAQNVGDTYFGLGARLTDKDGFDAMKLALADILTDVMKTSLDGTAFDLDGIAVTAADYASCKSWADYGSITDGKSVVEPDMALYIWEEKLSNLYNRMTSNDSEGIELRAGSGRAILSMVRDMWKEIYPMTITPATTKAEAVAKKLALAINAKLDNYFSYSTTGAQPNWAEPLTFDGTNDYANFPTNFNLMEGVAYLKFDATNKKFVYPDELNMMGMGSGFEATDFYYPAELLYFGNSPVHTSNVEYSAGDYPSSSTAWSSKEWATTGWPDAHVTATSRSVAMVKNIRYGVAMLETRVEYKGVDGSIKTNNPDLPDQTMAIRTVPTEDNPTTFELTGIIVGGQSTQVGWDFLPKSDKQGFIYDKFDAVSVPFPSSTYNYTVVFDNYNESAATVTPKTKQDKVYVALEFLNNGDDFYGKKNWVRTGEHFYLVGELDPGDPQAEPSSTEKPITWPNDGTIIPPYNADGTSTQQPRIFVQDYRTTVTFKIGPNSLQYAYLTVPDLRSSNMTLGLSVDIQWREGLKYDDVVVGQ